jgi:hypothetical protein
MYSKNENIINMSDKFFHQQYTTAPIVEGGVAGGIAGTNNFSGGAAANNHQAYQTTHNQPNKDKTSDPKQNGSKSYD